MDRLSAPANETQKTDRKFKGIRNLFKHSHSSSASSSSAILTKQPPLDGSSPLLSPYVRSGFKQVGLLPSERSYSSLFHRGKQEEHGRQPLVSTTENEEEHSSKSMTSLQNKDCGPAHVEDENVQNSKLRLQSLNDVLSKYPTEKEAHKGAVAEVDVTDIDQAISSDADKHSSLPFGSSHRIMEAMHDIAQSDSGSEEFCDSFSPDDYKARSIDATKQFLRSNCMSRHPTQAGPFCPAPNGVPYSYPLTIPREPEHDNTLINIEDDESGRRKSYVSNIFGDKSSLNQGVREYVGSKITEVLAEDDKKMHGCMQNAMGPPVQVVINFDLTGSTKASKTSQANGDGLKSDIYTGDSTIGPLAITGARILRELQMGTVCLYIIMLLAAAFLGPKTLFLTLWRMAVVLAVYAFAVSNLGWSEHLERDVFLAPVFFAKGMVQDIGGPLIAELRGSAVALVAEALQSVFKGAEVRAERW